MLKISREVALPWEEIEMTAIPAQGAGGQNVNKVASAIHLRFDIRASSLPAVYKDRLLQRRDQRITDEGVVIIKAQRYRTRERNRQDALQRLGELIRTATTVPKKRKSTRPSKAARARRLDGKSRRGRLKALRGKVKD